MQKRQSNMFTLSNTRQVFNVKKKRVFESSVHNSMSIYLLQYAYTSKQYENVA